ncbi:MAG: phage major capsid protein [Rickettsiales bacterium]
MSISEITDRVASLGNAWEQFKQVNDARLSEIERKGSADALYSEHLGNINAALDNYRSRLDAMEVAYNRPEFEEKQTSFKNEPAFHGEYSKAFRNYLRKGVEVNLDNLQTKALSVGSDPDGGYLVTPHMSAKITQSVFESSPLRQLASVETISTDSLELIDDHDQAAAGWTSETAAVSDTATPTIAKKSISTFELYAQPKATQKLVDDSAIDIESWLAGKIADIFSRKENTAFISGDGTTQPKGILTYTAGTSWGEIEQVNSGVDGALTADSIINLFYSLKDAYTKRASFLMNRTVVQSVRLLKQSGTGQYLWQPSLAAGAPDTLMGVPVYMAVDMPVAASNSLSVAVGDFTAAYQIVDRKSINILRDPFTEKPFVKFYATKRVGGDVINFEAIKLLKLAV